jgi:hypothetical protein
MLRRLASIAATVCAAGLIACVGSVKRPPTFEFEPTTVIKGDIDDVWTAVVEYFAIANLPIETIEQASGLIVTSWMDASDPEKTTREDRTICHCGKTTGVVAAQWTSGRFSIFVKEVPDGTELRVTCTFRQKRDVFMVADGQMANCNSTGTLEKALHDYIRAVVERGVWEEPPAFRPGQDV